MRGDGSSKRLSFRREPECGFDGSTCIRIVLILIYVI